MSIVNSEIFDYAKNKEYLEKILVTYPYVKCEVIGRTCLGRGIFAFKLGNESNQVLCCGGFHGSEWLTPPVLYRFIERLCEGIEGRNQISSVNLKSVFQNYGITIVPCVNPDGTEIAVHGTSGGKTLRRYIEKIPCEDYSKWNANALGVDINHNFNAGWEILSQMEKESGINGPAPRQYGGEFAESEIETRNLTKLCLKENFRQVLALHSQGEEIYWEYDENTPKQSQFMARVMAKSSGYAVSRPQGLASHGGFKDWFISRFHKPGFTMEIGKGENPLPKEDLDEIYNKIEEALVLFMLM